MSPAPSVEVAAPFLGEISDQPTALDRRAALAAMLLYLVGCFALVPFGGLPIPDIPVLTPAFGTAILFADLSTGFLLFVMFWEERRLSLLLLASAYLYSGAMAGLNIVTFPGLLQRDAIVLGTPQSAAWAILLFWMGYGLLTLSAVLVESFARTRIMDRRYARLTAAVGLISILALIGGSALLVIRFSGLLPALMHGSAFTSVLRAPRALSIGAMLATISVGALIAGRHSRVFLWLCLSVTAMLSVNILTLASGGRGTLGWSLGRVSWMLSSSVLFLFFMGRFASQLRFLARVTNILEARVRERTTDLTNSLQQQSLLLREVYHRVENNMQVIDSILFMERRRLPDGPTRVMIDLLQNRVLTLGLAHHQLMASSDLSHFGLSVFIEELASNLENTEAFRARGVTLEARVDQVDVTLDTAAPIGLLMTELAIKSLNDRQAKHILISIRVDGDGLANLTIEDDGAEFEYAGIDWAGRPGGWESKFFVGLVRQLDGYIAEVTENKRTWMNVMIPLTGKE